jgi:hypothetical protein
MKNITISKLFDHVCHVRANTAHQPPNLLASTTMALTTTTMDNTGQQGPMKANDG